MPTETVLINELLQKPISTPINWATLIGLPVGESSYVFVQTVKHINATIISVKLVLELRLSHKVFGSETWCITGIIVRFNEETVLSIGQKWEPNRVYTFEIDVSGLYRKLSGTVPQVLELVLPNSSWVAQDTWYVTAYLEITYTSGEVQRETSGSAFTMDENTALLSEAVYLMFQIIMIQLLSVLIGAIVYE